MPENTEGTAQNFLADKVLVKKNKLLFFALNLVCILPYLIKHYSHLEAGLAACFLLMLFILTVLQPHAATPAGKNLPLFGFFDVCILLGMSTRELLDRFTLDDLPHILARAEGRQCLLLLPVGLVLCVLPFRSSLAVWLKGLGRTAIGAFPLLLIWSNGKLLGISFADGGKGFFVFYLLCAAIWYTLCAVSYTVTPGALRRNNWLSWLLLLVFWALCLTETSLVWERILPIRDWLLAIPSLAWWKTILAVAVLIGCAIAAYAYADSLMGPDSLVLGALGGGILLLRVLLSNYFAFSWLVLLVFLAGALRCLQNEMRHTKTLRLSTPVYLAAQTAALLLTAFLLKRGLWVLLVLLVVYGLIFYAIHGKMETLPRQRCRWLVTLSCPAVLALGYIWQTRFIPAVCLLLAAAYGVLAFVILLLLWPHPSERRSPDRYKWMVCGAMALLCLMTATRYGVKAHITFQPERGTAHIELAARGGDNEIALAAYYWSDLTGEPLGEEVPLSSGETEIPIQGERLTIVATDTHGARTTVTDWYPGWMPAE